MTSTLPPQIKCMETDIVLNSQIKQAAIIKTAKRLSSLNSIKRLYGLTLLLFFTCEFYK